jgi:hypothetical protein
MRVIVIIIIALLNGTYCLSGEQVYAQVMKIYPGPELIAMEPEIKSRFNLTEKIIVAAAPIQQVELVESMNWKTYSNTEFDFSLRYPEDYVISEEKSPIAKQKPSPLFALRFHDKALHNAQPGYLEPPQFSVEIFPIKSDKSLKDWMRQNQMIPSLSDMEEYILDGHTGLLVKRREFIAPGYFLFVKKSSLIFKFSLLGDHLMPILNSFRFEN